MKIEDYIIILKIIKIFVFDFSTFYVSRKIINSKNIDVNKKFYKKMLEIVLIFIISNISIFIETKSNKFYSVIYLILFYAIMFSKIEQINIGSAIIVNLISVGINFVVFSIAVVICGIVPSFLNQINIIYATIFIFVVYILLLKLFFLHKKLKNGFSFIQKNIRDENIDNIILCVSVSLIFLITILTKKNSSELNSTFIAVIIISIIMFITISKSFQLYY